MESRLYTIRQTAKALQVSERTVHRMLRDGRLQGVKIGKSWRIQSASLNTFSQSDLMVHEEQPIYHAHSSHRITVSASVRTDSSLSDAAFDWDGWFERLDALRSSIQAESGTFDTLKLLHAARNHERRSRRD